jgi:hypothetical protein
MNNAKNIDELIAIDISTIENQKTKMFENEELNNIQKE